MKKILILLAALLIVPMSVNAEGSEYSTEKINNVENTETKTEEKTETTNNIITNSANSDDVINSVTNSDITVDEFGNRILKKLYEVADLLKKIAAPVAIIMFIVGAILMVTGALGRRDGAKQGLIVCVLSIITYAICMYSEPIIIAVSNWLAS